MFFLHTKKQQQQKNPNNLKLKKKKNGYISWPELSLSAEKTDILSYCWGISQCDYPLPPRIWTFI